MPHPYDPGHFASEYNTPHGQKAWEVLNRPDVVARMETASDLGQPALKPVEDILLHELGETALQDRFKQMLGHMVRQVMERIGFEHDTGDVRLSSVPFYKASRYRRRDRSGVFLFRNSKDVRDLCLTNTRKGEELPEVPVGGRWTYVNFVTSPLKAQIGYGFDLKAMVAAVEKAGFVRHRMERVMKAG